MKRLLSLILCMALVAVPVMSTVSSTDSDAIAPCFFLGDMWECD